MVRLLIGPLSIVFFHIDVTFPESRYFLMKITGVAVIPNFNSASGVWFLVFKIGKAPTTSSKDEHDEHVSPLGGFLLFFRGYTPKSSILTALTGFSIINHPHLWYLWTPPLIHIKRLTRKKHHDSEHDAVEESVYWWFIYIISYISHEMSWVMGVPAPPSHPSIRHWNFQCKP